MAEPAFSPELLSRDVELIRKIVAVAHRSLETIRFLVNWICVGLLCAMTALIFLQILGRYVFNYSISWSEEAAIFAQIWLVMLGSGVAMRNRHHAGVDIIIARCPANVQRLVKSASALLVAWFLLVVIVSSFSMISFGLIVSSPALQLPMAMPYSALPVGLSYFLLEFAIATVPEIRDPASAPQSAGAVE